MNRRDTLKSIGMGLMLLAAGVSETIMFGCGIATAQWITLGLNLIATILPTLPSIISSISALAGHNVLSAAQVTKLTQVFQGIQDLFKTAQDSLTLYEMNHDSTLIAKIQDIVKQIETKLGGVLVDVQVTDPATVAKLTVIINSLVTLADNLLVIIPAVSPTGKITGRRPTAAQLAQVSPDVWAARFNRDIQIPTGNKVVDEAFANVKAVPVH